MALSAEHDRSESNSIPAPAVWFSKFSICKIVLAIRDRIRRCVDAVPQSDPIEVIDVNDGRHRRRWFDERELWRRQSHFGFWILEQIGRRRGNFPVCARSSRYNLSLPRASVAEGVAGSSTFAPSSSS